MAVREIPLSIIQGYHPGPGYINYGVQVAITYARQPPSAASTAASFTHSVFPPCMPYLSTPPFAEEPRPPGRLPEQRGATNTPKNTSDYYDA
jgi:hypothetical protein